MNTESLSEEQRVELEKALDRIMEDRKAHLVPAQVFCVSCGGGKRTPLRKWHNSYICQHCWKIKNTIGEEEFIKKLYPRYLLDEKSKKKGTNE